MCKFCEEYAFLRELPHPDDIKNEYTVAIVGWSIIEKKRRGRTVTFKHNGVGFPLKYCPECGKELKKARGLIQEIL